MQDQPKETASAGKTPDYESLTAEVKKTVEEKRAQGFYDPEEERRVAQMEVEFIQPQEDGAEAEIRLHQQKLAQLWDSKACGVQTHRPGPAGRLLLKFKRLFHRLTRFPVNIWLARQALFNDELVKLLNLLLLQHTDLRQRVARDEKRLDSLENLEGPIGARLNALDKGVVHRLDGHDQNLTEHDKRFEQVQRYADARVAALEREAGKGHSQIEQTLARLQDILEKQAEAGLASSAASQAVSQERARLRAGAYLAFEDMHRGSSQDIKNRQEVYVPIFKESVTPEKPLLDIGCGRGEFLELAREAGITAKGVDLNPEMAAFCRTQGLEVAEADALEYLRQLPDASLGGILASQLIEHLILEELTELVSLCATKLTPGGALVAETINPQCLTTFSGAFYLDLTHQKPIHPEAARFLWQWAGLAEVEIIYLSPYPKENRLESFSGEGGELADSYSRNMERLNQLLYGYQDYAVKGRK